MVIAIFDIPREQHRQLVRRRLHELGFVQLFRNTMVSTRCNDLSAVRRRLGHRTTGRPARVLLLKMKRKVFDEGAWVNSREVTI